MTKPLCCKASQVAKAANSLPKPSQIHSKPTAYTQASLWPLKSGPTGSSQRSFCSLSFPIGKDPWDDHQQKGHHETSTRRTNKKASPFSPIWFQAQDKKTYLQAEVVTGEHLLVTEQSSEPQHAAPEWGTSWFSTGSSGGRQLGEMQPLLQAQSWTQVQTGDILETRTRQVPVTADLGSQTVLC